MKIRRFDLDDDEELATITVEMTVDEAALIYAFVGNTSPKQVTEVSGWSKWAEVLNEVANGLSGGIFNRWYEAGWSEVGPKGFGKVKLGETP